MLGWGCGVNIVNIAIRDLSTNILDYGLIVGLYSSREP